MLVSPSLAHPTGIDWGAAIGVRHVAIVELGKKSWSLVSSADAFDAVSLSRLGPASGSRVRDWWTISRGELMYPKDGDHAHAKDIFLFTELNLLSRGVSAELAAQNRRRLQQEELQSTQLRQEGVSYAAAAGAVGGESKTAEDQFNKACDILNTILDKVVLRLGFDSLRVHKKKARAAAEIDDDDGVDSEKMSSITIAGGRVLEALQIIAYLESPTVFDSGEALEFAAMIKWGWNKESLFDAIRNYTHLGVWLKMHQVNSELGFLGFQMGQNKTLRELLPDLVSAINEIETARKEAEAAEAAAAAAAEVEENDGGGGAAAAEGGGESKSSGGFDSFQLLEGEQDLEEGDIQIQTRRARTSI
eukprot:g4066.t1